MLARSSRSATDNLLIRAGDAAMVSIASRIQARIISDLLWSVEYATFATRFAMASSSITVVFPSTTLMLPSLFGCGVTRLTARVILRTCFWPTDSLLFVVAGPNLFNRLSNSICYGCADMRSSPRSMDNQADVWRVIAKFFSYCENGNLSENHLGSNFVWLHGSIISFFRY